MCGRVDLHDVCAGFPGVNDLGGSGGSGDRQKLVLVRVLDEVRVRMRGDDDLGARPASRRGVVGRAYRSSCNRDALWPEVLADGRHQLQGIRRREGDFNDLDTVLRIRLGDSQRRSRTVFTNDADDLVSTDFGQEVFAGHDLRILSGLSWGGHEHHSPPERTDEDVSREDAKNEAKSVGALVALLRPSVRFPSPEHSDRRSRRLLALARTDARARRERPTLDERKALPRQRHWEGSRGSRARRSDMFATPTPGTSGTNI